MKKRNEITVSFLFLIIMGLFLGCTGHPTHNAEYIIDLQGELKEDGVITFAGYDMNVYFNQASNPCGSCESQPVSVYVGAKADEVAKAIGESIERSDDLWSVKEISGTKLILQEKEAGSAEKPDDPNAPSGLTITGTFQPAK